MLRGKIQESQVYKGKSYKSGVRIQHERNMQTFGY